MTARCACGRALATGPGVYLPRLKLRIFEIVRRAGRDGIDSATLLSEFGLPIKQATLKVHVHQINEALRPTGFRISDARGRRGYRLLAPHDGPPGRSA
jgi:hypothetical protein